MNFLAPFKFYRDEPRMVIMQAIFCPQGDKLIARLPSARAGESCRTKRNRRRHALHCAGAAGKTDSEAAWRGSPRLSAEAIVEAAQIYRVYFHGPAYQVLERAWWDGERMIGELATICRTINQPPIGRHSWRRG